MKRMAFAAVLLAGVGAFTLPLYSHCEVPCGIYDDPARINALEDEFRKVTPELIRQTAEQYLRPTGKTVFTIEAGAQG